MVRHGPVRPSVKETRPEATERASDVPEYGEGRPALPLPRFDIRVPPEPRKKPTRAFISNVRQLDTQSAEVVVSRTVIIWGFMPCSSIPKIPKAAGSDKKLVKDPYAADI